MHVIDGIRRIAVLDDFQGVALEFGDWARLDETDLTVFRDHVDDDDELVERLAPFDIVVAMRERTPFTRNRLGRLPRLRLLVTTGMVNRSIDLAAAQELGVLVCGTRGLVSPPVELTWGLILALTRNICVEDAAMRTGAWQTTVGTELAGHTLGVVGLGRLGGRVATIAHAFDMEVIAWSRNLTSERAGKLNVEAVSREELFERSDVVTVHLVLSERTRGLIGADDLQRMKPTAYLVNTARGPIVHRKALLEALETRTIAGAGLDVFDVEPLPLDDRLRTLPNTVLTPHLGFVSGGAYKLFYGDAIEDVEAFLLGAPIRVLAP